MTKMMHLGLILQDDYNLKAELQSHESVKHLYSILKGTMNT